MNQPDNNPDSQLPDEIDPYTRDTSFFVDPPTSAVNILKNLGPGIILVGSIVGSGELIMTTKLGAQAGFVLLWFVLVSCLLKVVIQGELTRHTISSGRTFLDVFNSLPGPKCRRPVWLTLGWLGWITLSSYGSLACYTLLPEAKQTAQLAYGVVAGVILSWGMCAAIISARRDDAVNRGQQSMLPSERPNVNWFTWVWMGLLVLFFMNGGAILGGAGQAMELAFPKLLGDHGATIWTVIVAAGSASILLSGKYGTLEKVSIGLVATFTVVTIICTVLLQWTGHAVTFDDIKQGLQFDLPGNLNAVIILTALGMYAGTGVGWGEVCNYTYFCVEKGYARNVGEREQTDAWANRARGWIRVMYIDVLITMVVYTVGTICFFFLGASILHSQGLDPSGPETLSTLSNMYTESLGSWAATLFIVGAFFVLFSTVLAGVAGVSRLMTDTLHVLGIVSVHDYTARMRVIRFMVVFTLSMHAFTYSLFENPPLMLMIAGLIAVFMYPVLGLGAIYLRHTDVDPRIAPSKPTTVWLWICGGALAVISPGAIVLMIALQSGWITIGG